MVDAGVEEEEGRESVVVAVRAWREAGVVAVGEMMDALGESVGFGVFWVVWWWGLRGEGAGFLFEDYGCRGASCGGGGWGLWGWRSWGWCGRCRCLVRLPK